MNKAFERHTYSVDVCVVGGGMAGLIAAVAAARRGCSVVLVHDRPVLGGNASSEVRMWICGAHGPHNKETGILEEIQLVNLLRNPAGCYSVWDSVLFEFAKMTPGLTTLLNCTCTDGETADGALQSVKAWQLTTQSWHLIEAKFFIDCSGDSILAPIAGAETRTGREAREEFGESLAPLKSDLKTMGNTLLLQLEEMPSPQAFRPPVWANYFDDQSTLPSRLGQGLGHNFWWLELGGIQNTIRDAEQIRDQLMAAVWGVWDYMKNRGPQADRLRNWRVRWMGALPGKRENRRYLGPYILTQNDIDAGGIFDDIVAYGGWSMDDHHPAGLLYPGQATLFHKAPSPYGIPFRCLYSRNIPNLFCAGRNISATHCALSSTRVMATCALIGQAVGTAAALGIHRGLAPGQFSAAEIRELQQHLMEDDCWLPGLTKPIASATRDARLVALGNADELLDGQDRPIGKMEHVWTGQPGSEIRFEWDRSRPIRSIRLVFDSDLNAQKQLPCKYGCNDAPHTMPGSLVKSFQIEIQRPSGHWESLLAIDENAKRLWVVPVTGEIHAIRFVGNAAWGGGEIRVFSMEATEAPLPPTHILKPGKAWTELMASVDPADLAPPDHGLEAKARGLGLIGA